MNFIYLPDGSKHYSAGLDRSKLEKKLSSAVSVLYNTFLKYIPNPDLKVRQKGYGIYKDTYADIEVKSSIENIEQSINALEIEYKQNECPQKQFDIIVKLIDKLLENNFQKAILSSAWYGINYIELIWENVDGYLLPMSFVQHPRENFIYKYIDNEFKVFMITEESNLEGTEIPEYKFLIPRYDESLENPYGKGLLSYAFKTVFIKENALDFFSMLVEDHGTPKLDATVSTSLSNLMQNDGYNKEQILRQIQDDVESIRQNGVFTHFEGLEVKSLTTAVSEKGVLHQQLLDYCDKKIAKLFLGHQGASESTPGKLGSEDMAQANVSNRTKAYAKHIAANLNLLLEWVVAVNFEGIPVPYINLFEKDNIDAYVKKAELANSLATLGVAFNEEYIINEFGIDQNHFTISNDLSQEKKVDKTVSKLNHSCFISAVKEDLSAQDAVNALDDFITYIESSDEYTEIQDKHISAITNFVDSCESYEEMLGKLFSSYSSIPRNDLSNMLTKMLLISRGYGLASGVNNGKN